MSAYRFWTLTCDGCGEIFDYGTAHTVAEAKRAARRYGWTTGRTKNDEDYCSRVCIEKGQAR